MIVSQCVKLSSEKVGRAENGHGRPGEKLHTVHRVSKLSEVHNPAVIWLLKKIPASMKLANFTKRANFTKNYSRFHEVPKAI